MESILVVLFVFISIVSSIAYFIELHMRLKREEELDRLTHLTTTQFSDWKRKKKGVINEKKHLSSDK